MGSSTQFSHFLIESMNRNGAKGIYAIARKGHVTQYHHFLCSGLWRAIEMKYKIILLLLLFGCVTPPRYEDKKIPEKDPLLESIEYYRAQDCLRNCADSDKWGCD